MEELNAQFVEDAQRLVKAAETVSERCVDMGKLLEERVSQKELTVSQLVEYWLLARRVNDTIEAGRKELGKLVQHLSMEKIPNRFEAENLKTITTDSGYRITVAYRFSVSMLDKEKAYEWLRKNELGDLIIETVNSGTLSSQIRQMIEKEGIDPPDDIFKQSNAPYTSATKV